VTPPPSSGPPARTPVPEKAAYYTRLFIILMVVAWIVSAMPFPLRFGLVLASAAAGAAGIMALIEAFKAPGATTLRILLGVGGAVAGYLGLLGIGYILVAPDVMAYESCMSTALTPQRENQCRADYRQDVFDRYGIEIP
jgi:hypothetical protein